MFGSTRRAEVRLNHPITRLKRTHPIDKVFVKLLTNQSLKQNETAAFNEFKEGATHFAALLHDQFRVSGTEFLELDDWTLGYICGGQRVFTDRFFDLRDFNRTFQYLAIRFLFDQCRLSGIQCKKNQEAFEREAISRIADASSGKNLELLSGMRVGAAEFQQWAADEVVYPRELRIHLREQSS